MAFSSGLVARASEDRLNIWHNTHVVCGSQRCRNNRNLRLHGLGKLTPFDRPDAARIGRQAIEHRQQEIPILHVRDAQHPRKRSRMERSDPNFTIPYDAPSAYELADSSYAPLILGNIWTLAASSAHVRMRTPMAFAANLSFVLKSLPADGTGAAR